YNKEDCSIAIADWYGLVFYSKAKKWRRLILTSGLRHQKGRNSKMKMKKILAMALASAMVLSLGACGSSDSGSTSGSDSSAASDGTEAVSSAFPGTAEDDTYVVDLRAEPPEMNSILTTDVASGDILREVMVGLYKLDENDTPQPDLAETTEVSDDRSEERRVGKRRRPRR